MPPERRNRTRQWIACLTATASYWALSTASALANSTEDLRDPFMFEPLPHAVAAPAPRPLQTLVGILWDAAHPLAIIGDQTVGVGDTVSGWQVTRIQQNGVEIQRGDRHELLAPGSSIPSD